jgi:hypothetical protein
MEYGCVGGFVSDCDVFFQSPNYFKVGTSPAGAAAHPGEAGDKKKTVQAAQQISHWGKWKISEITNMRKYNKEYYISDGVK